MSRRQVVFEDNVISVYALMLIVSKLLHNQFQSKIIDKYINILLRYSSGILTINVVESKLNFFEKFTFISWIVDTLCIEAMISESNGGDIPPGQPIILDAIF